MDLRESQKGCVSRHPWELARAEALRAIAGCYVVPYDGAGTLDIGCGDGFIIDSLCAGRGGNIDAVDINLTPEQIKALSSERPGVSFHNTYQALAGNKYGLITMFDVLEHVEDDGALLRDTVTRFAAPGGSLFCTVPAFQDLYCSHDVFLRHYRRYNISRLRGVLEGAGLRVIGSGYLFGLLLPVRALGVATERLFGAADKDPGIGHWRHGRLFTTAVKAVLDADNRLLIQLSRAGITLPGLTVWALCETPGPPTQRS